MGDRRHLTLSAVVTALAACALTGCGGHAPTASTASTATTADAGPTTCTAAALRVRLGPEVSPATGEHPSAFYVVNSGRRACRLIGYPTVRFYSGSSPMPFTYADGGGPYLSARPPKLIVLKPGGRALFVIAQYRCDIGVLRTSTSARLRLPGVPGTRPLRAGASYCRKASPTGPPDPGNTIVVSPLVRTVRETV